MVFHPQEKLLNFLVCVALLPFHVILIETVLHKREPPFPPKD